MADQRVSVAGLLRLEKRVSYRRLRKEFGGGDYSSGPRNLSPNF